MVAQGFLSMALLLSSTSRSRCPDGTDDEKGRTVSGRYTLSKPGRLKRLKCLLVMVPAPSYMSSSIGVPRSVIVGRLTAVTVMRGPSRSLPRTAAIWAPVCGRRDQSPAILAVDLGYVPDDHLLRGLRPQVDARTPGLDRTLRRRSWSDLGVLW